jgi:hypothetical protein
VQAGAVKAAKIQQLKMDTEKELEDATRSLAAVQQEYDDR